MQVERLANTRTFGLCFYVLREVIWRIGRSPGRQAGKWSADSRGLGRRQDRRSAFRGSTGRKTYWSISPSRGYRSEESRVQRFRAA